MHLFAAVLATVLAQCTLEAEMKILARRVFVTARALAVACIDPRAVAVVAEQIRFRYQRSILRLLYVL